MGRRAIYCQLGPVYGAPATPLGIMGGCAGRCHALSLGVGVMVSVVSGPDRKSHRFSAVASEMVRGSVAAVYHGAGRGWRCVVRETPCRRASTGRQEGFYVHGNATHALRALGGPITSIRRGRGGVHGEARAGLARGIGHRGRHGAGGEVTVQWVVGGALPLIGILGGHGDVLGGMGWLGRVSARWGQARGPAGRRPTIGGRRQHW
jgi:hypothetical protein